MKKKIILSVFIIAVTILCTSLAAVMGILHSYFTRLQKEQLQCQMELAAVVAEKEGVAYLGTQLWKEYRITLVAADGQVLYDSQADPATMENHQNREEIEEAIRTGKGESSRYSDTMTQKAIYLAKRLSNGTVLRISVAYATMIALLFRMFPVIVLVIIIAALLSVWLADWMSKRIVAPLNSLNLEQPLENNTYDEISPLLLHIAEQQIQIKSQMEQLENSKLEFKIITENMSEGLVLLNCQGIILSMNRAAKQLFQTDDNCIGKEFLSIERHTNVTRCLEYATKSGHGETTLDQNDRTYQLMVSKISTEYRISGLAILCIDVTEKISAEQVRKEFSANVSHELKTPLQSIMGSAELIESGMVKEEDLPRFIGHIRAEATRLMALINDLIRLSQLDETIEIPKEEIDLYEVSQEVVHVLQRSAKERNISLSLEGNTVRILGIRQYVYEIIYNLCDNAIRYNKQDGNVKLIIESGDEKARLLVSDTGIGIAPEYQERIFERFFRVDKSHSKATGGTGLGLSIVKHAAKQLGATLNLVSKPGTGTDITVMFRQ